MSPVFTGGCQGEARSGGFASEKLDEAEVNDVNDAEGGEGATRHETQRTADDSACAVRHHWRPPVPSVSVRRPATCIIANGIRKGSDLGHKEEKKDRKVPRQPFVRKIFGWKLPAAGGGKSRKSAGVHKTRKMSRGACQVLLELVIYDCNTCRVICSYNVLVQKGPHADVGFGTESAGSECSTYRP